jgi:hypothetical protein
MKLGYGLCLDRFEKLRKTCGILTIGLLVLGLLHTLASAADLSAQPADTLNDSNFTTNLLPQTQATSEEWLSGLHVSGYASQTFGMWQNPPALRAFTPSRNNLAVARSLLQVDENYRLNENNNFFMREWFVYEPPYSFDSANNAAYGAASAFHPSFGHLMNGFYNNYQVRDAWWENKTGPLTTFVGNQIVVWGQSLAFRVGDVVNPTDTCWNFGFANLEQSRNAQWMLHPILNLPEWGPLNSNFLELIVQPGFAPVWWPEQTGDPLNKYHNGLTAGRNVPCVPSASHGPSARFDLQYPTQPKFGFGYPGNPFQPTARAVFICNPAAVPAGWNPYTIQLRHFAPTCNLGLNRQQGTYGPNGDGTGTDIGFWRVPGMQPQNWNEGVRFHTLIGATELTALYYNDNTSGGGPAALRWVPFTNLWRYDDSGYNEAGVTMDRPLPIPASIAEFVPAIMRAEMLYTNHTLFSDAAFNSMTAIRWSDTVKYMIAIDLDQAYAPWLTSTGNLTANFELLHNIILDDSKTCTFTAFGSNCLKNDVDMLLNVGTSWWWDDFNPDWTMIFNPKGRTFALFPSLTLNPPWTKKYFLKLQAIEIMGGDKDAPQTLGIFKGESLLTAQFQYNFNLL